MRTILLIVLGVLFFGLLIAVHELGHFFVAKLSGVRVNEFSIGMGPKLLSRKGKETAYTWRLFPIGGFCTMEGEDEDSADPRSFQKAKAWKKFLILVAGAAMNFITGFLIFLLFVGSAGVHTMPVVDSFLPGYEPPAGECLQAGDRILSVDGHRIWIASDIDLYFQRSGDSLDLVVMRRGERVSLDGFYMPYRNFDGQMKRGIVLSPGKISGLDIFRLAGAYSVDTVRLVWMSLGDLLTGAVGIRDMSGPVGIVNLMGQVAEASPTTVVAVRNILYLVGFIAVNLAVMNLLPIPALDGGRIFFLVINGIFTLITRRKLDPKYEGMVNMVGFILLLGLMAVVAVSDIFKLFGR